jgi:hypothetical protein
MQVQSFDQRDMKRATRGRRPGFDCAPEMAMGQRVGTVASMDNKFLMQNPPTPSANLIHQYKGSKSLTGVTQGTTTTVNAADAAAGGPWAGESPTGVARRLTTNTNGSLQHGITRALTANNEGNTYATVRVWVRQSDNASFQWIYLQTGGGAYRAWFDIFNGVIGSTTGTSTPRIVRSFLSPTDGKPWFLLEMEFSYGSGANGIFICIGDGNVAYDLIGLPVTEIIYDSIEFTQDKVVQWSDLSGTDHLLQATVNSKPGWFAQSPNLQGEPSVRLYNSHFLQASTAANWQFLNSGAGGTWAFPWRCTNLTTNTDESLMTTNGASTTATGISLTYNPSNGGMKYDIGGAGSNKNHYQSFFNSLGAGGADIRNVANWVGCSCDSSDTPDTRWMINGVEIANGNPSGGYTVAAPSTGLRLGIGALDFFEIPELLFWNRALTTAEWQQVHYYFRYQYGTYQP